MAEKGGKILRETGVFLLNSFTWESKLAEKLLMDCLITLNNFDGQIMPYLLQVGF